MSPISLAVLPEDEEDEDVVVVVVLGTAVLPDVLKLPEVAKPT